MKRKDGEQWSKEVCRRSARTCRRSPRRHSRQLQCACSLALPGPCAWRRAHLENGLVLGALAGPLLQQALRPGALLLFAHRGGGSGPRLGRPARARGACR